MTQTNDQILNGVFTCDECGRVVPSIDQSDGHVCEECQERVNPCGAV